MSELLVRLVDKTSGDPYNDAKLTKAGDVIVMLEDGHQWGAAEGPPNYRIVRVPGAEPQEFASLLARQPAQTDSLDHTAILRSRAFGLKLHALKDTMTPDQVMAARVRKSYLQDPNVLE